MSLSNAYVIAASRIPAFFDALRQGQAPKQFTQQLLKDLGFASSNDRALIPLLKSLGFLSPDGKPTSRYHEYRDHSKSRNVMAEAIKEAYEEIFLITEKPSNSDKNKIQGKFKSYHNTSDHVANLMANTFLKLLSLADLDKSKKKITKKSPEPDTKVIKDKADAEGPNSKHDKIDHDKVYTGGLHYNIQIHLPATKDIEVYNAIFKSIKEHLFED